MIQGLPPQHLVEQSLLLVLKSADHPVRTNKLYHILAGQFGLKGIERYGHPFDPRGSSWELLVRMARRNLQDQGLLLSPRHGCWSLTHSGHAAAEKLVTDRRDSSPAPRLKASAD
jgi:hypothetical protein